MGCNESREKESREKESRKKERPPGHLTFAVATPLPLHLYHEYAYPIRKSPTSSTGSLSPPSLSPTARASPTSLLPTVRASPTAKSSPSIKSVTTLHYTKLKAIAHYKFPTFNDFSSDVQQEILHHIDKELEKVK